MKKKIILIFIVSILVFACGKKGDPEFKESKINLELKKTVINII